MQYSEQEILEREIREEIFGRFGPKPLCYVLAEEVEGPGERIMRLWAIYSRGSADKAWSNVRRIGESFFNARILSVDAAEKFAISHARRFGTELVRVITDSVMCREYLPSAVFDEFFISPEEFLETRLDAYPKQRPK